MRNALVAAGTVAGLVAGCTWVARPLPEPDRQAPADFPEAQYLQAAARGDPMYRVDPASSLVVIEVRRGGSLARLGHDHVVASHDVRGYVAPGQGRSDLYVRLDRLVVDEPELRARAGFDTQPTEDDIAGTRRNMLNGLGAAEHPFARVGIAKGATGGPGDALSVSITLNGTTRTQQVPVQLNVRGDVVAVTGRLSLRQTDFGIEPLSVLGGALQVQDVVNLRFEIRARRVR